MWEWSHWVLPWIHSFFTGMWTLLGRPPTDLEMGLELAEGTPENDSWQPNYEDFSRQWQQTKPRGWDPTPRHLQSDRSFPLDAKME
jgi:hypothetical protein